MEARSWLTVSFGSGTRIVKRDEITVSSQLQPLPFQTSHLTPVPEEVWVTDVGDRNDCISSFFVIRFQVSRSPHNRRERAITQSGTLAEMNSGAPNHPAFFFFFFFFFCPA